MSTHNLSNYDVDTAYQLSTSICLFHIRFWSMWFFLHQQFQSEFFFFFFSIKKLFQVQFAILICFHWSMRKFRSPAFEFAYKLHLFQLNLRKHCFSAIFLIFRWKFLLSIFIIRLFSFREWSCITAANA